MSYRADPDEDPSDEDVQRFGEGEATVRCPDCGASVWAEADICPKCFTILTGDLPRRGPLAVGFHRRFKVVVVLALLFLFLGGFTVFRCSRQREAVASRPSPPSLHPDNAS